MYTLRSETVASLTMVFTSGAFLSGGAFREKALRSKFPVMLPGMICPGAKSLSDGFFTSTPYSVVLVSMG